LEGRLSRAALLDGLVELASTRRSQGVLRVAVDGPDSAGKTTLADELADRLNGVAEVIRAGIDGFHRPRTARYRRGSLSPEGAYHDTFDYPALRSALLDPLGPAGDRRYRTAVFDYRTDQAVNQPIQHAPSGAVLIFDGVFLLRPQLRHCWDISVYLDVSPSEVLRRAAARDAKLMGGQASVIERYSQRYLPAQRLYRAEATPELLADILVHNDDPAHPRLTKWPS
jgi:uridine kinase